LPERARGPAVDLTRVKPYADHLGDGLVQLSFTLPVPYGLGARRAAQELAAKMGLEHPEVVHYQRLTDGYSFFVMFGECTHSVDYSSISADGFDVEYMTEEEIEAFAREHVGRPIVVVGASTGTDTHSVGIDAMLNLKGFHGHHGLEGYKAFRAYNLGSQVPNSVLVQRALELGADALLVSQTVTQQNLHIANLTELVEIVEAEGARKRLILTCGGPRVTNELAKELGYDAGFSKGTYPHHVASFIVRELAARMSESRDAAGATSCFSCEPIALAPRRRVSGPVLSAGPSSPATRARRCWRACWHLRGVWRWWASRRTRARPKRSARSSPRTRARVAAWASRRSAATASSTTCSTRVSQSRRSTCTRAASWPARGRCCARARWRTSACSRPASGRRWERWSSPACSRMARWRSPDRARRQTCAR
jgi:beta-lysine 5,6-aminomutase beta subunit